MSTSVSFRRRAGALCAGAAFGLGIALSFSGTARAQTLEDALSRAYGANPTLNAQRASVRATDEQVPQALSGYRPTITASGDYGIQRSRAEGTASAVVPTTVNSEGAVTGYSPLEQKYRQTDNSRPRGFGVTADQTIFDGFRRQNQLRSAESNVLGAREQLLNSEQNVLFDTAQAYMDVLRDYAILDVRRNNVDVLREELKAARERFQVGEVTR
ncbi:MAG TPA: TolC family protein, partial [Hansschlegelia sp.]